MNPVKFSLSKKNLLLPSILLVIGVPLVAYFSYPSIGILGVSFWGLLWLLFLGNIIFYLRNSKVYCEVTEQDIKISDGANIVKFDFSSEVANINTQILISKRMGVYEAQPYLVLGIANESKYKLAPLSSSREYGFIQKIDGITNYMGEERGDVYIAIRTLEEDKLNDIKSLLGKPLTPLKPLVKTSSKEEYDEILSKNAISTH